MIPDDISKRIQALFRPSPALLVGSGFSCVYGLPGMAEIATYLLEEFKTSILSPDAKALWDRHREEIKRDFEGGLNQIPIGAAAREELTEEIRRLISGLICNRTASAESAIRDAPEPDKAAPARLLQRLFEGLPQNSECASVITTNYDTLLELFCDLARLPIDTGFDGHRYRVFRKDTIYRTHFRSENVASKRGVQVDFRRVPNVRVMKPHGSITWHSTLGGPVEILDYRDASSRAIVIPGPTKYEDALVTNLFDSIRAEMNSALRSATSLMCVGFGFNDAHLQGVITDRLANKMPLLILTRSFTKNIQNLLARFPHIIAIAKGGDGGVCHVDGNIHKSEQPIWELDCFLKTFLE